MKSVLIHLSEMHYKQYWEEDQDLILQEFLRFRKAIISKIMFNIKFQIDRDVAS